jgi:cell division protein FtsB
MVGLFLVLFLLSLAGLITGLTRPDLVIKWGRLSWQEEEVRRGVPIICGLSALVFFVLIAFTAPPTIVTYVLLIFLVLLFIGFFLLSFLALLIGLINPRWVIRWGEKRGRRQVVLTYGSAVISFFILFYLFAIAASQNELIRADDLERQLKQTESTLYGKIDKLSKENEKLKQKTSRLKKQLSRLKEQIKTLTAEGLLPNYVGKNVEEAKSDIESKGWLATVKEQVSEKSPGTIIGQAPAAGTKMKAGAKVELVVAKKPPPGWKTLYKWSGRGSYNTPLVNLPEGQLKVVYSFTGDTNAIIALMTPPDEQVDLLLNEIGNFKGETYLYYTGQYFFRIEGGRWTVQVQQFK